MERVHCIFNSPICNDYTILFQESCKEDEALEPLLDAVRVLTVMLSKSEADSDKDPGKTGDDVCKML